MKQIKHQAHPKCAMHATYGCPQRRSFECNSLHSAWMWWALMLVFLLPFGNAGMGFAQKVAINSTGALPNPSALLDVDASPTNDKGILIPRVSLTNSTVYAPIVGAPVTSLLVYNTNAAMIGGTVGYWYWDGTKWVQLGAAAAGGNDWLLLGNAGTVDGINFIGTTDDIAFNIRINNQKAGRITSGTGGTYGEVFLGYQAGNSNAGFNTGIGWSSLFANTSGSGNTAIGSRSLYSNTTGTENNAFGDNALYFNTTGIRNVAIGNSALMQNNGSIGNEGSYNVAIGNASMDRNTTGYWNTAVGASSLFNNTTGYYNTGLGLNALYSNTTGIQNTATGLDALYSNTTGAQNTASGVDALYFNTTGNANTASGYLALTANTTGYQNTAIGVMTLKLNTTGFNNAANGENALYSNTTGINNTANGGGALMFNTAGSNNTALGYSAGAGAPGVDFIQCTFVGSSSSPSVARTNVTMLGFGILDPQCTGNDQVLIGNTAITQIRAQVTGITAYSDARFKTNIKENVAGLDFILKLKPVTYNVHPKELHKIWGTPDSLVSKMDFSNAEKETRIGFIAQDVEKAAKESDVNFPGRDIPRNDKEVYTLRYVDFIMPMVKAMQEQQQEIQNYKKQLEEYKVFTANLKAEVDKIKMQLSSETHK